MHRVQKLLSNYGYCSRRKGEELIKEGRVKVNGNIISLGDKASENDKITVDGKEVSSSKRVYLMFNKPVGCVTALNDKHFKTVMDYIDVEERVFPIGRLDRHTSGLLLLTNDGDFANRIMHPRYEIKKTYLVRLDKKVAKDDIKKIEAGILLEDGKTSQTKLFVVNEALVEIKIHEGKNRIVRRIFEELGYKVVQLKRIKIGKLDLGKLPVKKYKDLSEADIEKIFSK